MRERGGILFLVIILLTSTVSVDILLPAHTQQTIGNGRSVEPDLNVTSVILLGGGIEQGGSNYISTGEHLIRVTIINDGLAFGTGTLSIVHLSDATDENTTSPVNTTREVSLTPGSSNTYLFGWVASAGAGQMLRAEVETTETNKFNDLGEIRYDVSDVESGELIADTLPSEGSRHLPSLHTYQFTIRNNGTVAMMAQAEVTITPPVGSPVQATSLSMAFPPGSLSEPAQAITLTVEINTSTIGGDCLIEGVIHLAGDVGFDILLPARNAVFSIYRASLSPPADKAVEPGGGVQLTFLLQNTGEAIDRYIIESSSSLGWANISGLSADTGLVSSTSSIAIVVPVEVPLNASRSEVDNIWLNLTSVAEGYLLTESVNVMAGDLLEGTLTPSVALTNITPGTSLDIPFTLENSGNVPATFDLESGLGTPAIGWSTIPSSTTTDLMLPGETRQIEVTVEPPQLSLPLDPALKLRAGDSLSLWLQATPTQGGLPSISSTTLEVTPTIVVDPGVPNTEIQITPEELKSGQVQRFIDLELKVMHNLVSDLSGGVIVNLSILPLQFNPDTADTGEREDERWNASLTPSELSLGLGGVEEVTLSLIGPPNSPPFMHPLAGLLSVPVHAETTLGGNISSISSAPVTSNLSVRVLQLEAVSISESIPLLVPPGTTHQLNLTLNNEGNDVTSYSLETESPINWLVSLNRTSVLNLPAGMGLWPATTSLNTTLLSLSVTVPYGAEADAVHQVMVRVRSRATGELLESVSYTFEVGKRVDANLHPPTALANLPADSGDPVPVTLLATNLGNTPHIFTLSIEWNESLGIGFLIEGATEFVLQPDEAREVKVQVFSNPTARADVPVTAWVNISNDLGEALNTTVVTAQIEDDHLLQVTPPSLTEVIPGTNVTLPFILQNIGNLHENMTITAFGTSNWNLTLSKKDSSLEPSDVDTVEVLVEVPMEEFGEVLQVNREESVSLTITSEDGTILSSDIPALLVVAHWFELEVIEWNEEVLFRPGQTRILEAKVKNIGNVDVNINTSSVQSPSGYWTINSMQIHLPLNEEVSVTFVVTAHRDDYTRHKNTTLEIALAPVEDVQGVATLVTNLRIERMFVEEDHGISRANLTIWIPWSHVPSLGLGGSARYELEMFGMHRTPGITGEDWQFTLLRPSALGGEVLMAEGDKWELAEVSPNSEQFIRFKVTLPDRDVAGDGYRMTLRLFNLEEGATFVEAQFQLWLHETGDPGITAIAFMVEGEPSQQIPEGLETQLVVGVRNNGTAGVENVTVTVTCGEGVNILEDATQSISRMEAGESTELSWNVESEQLDWWSSEASATCSATFGGSSDFFGNVPNDDDMALGGSIDSTSPNLLLVVVGALGFAILSYFLYRMGLENDKWRNLSSYTGSLALGLTFHLVPSVAFLILLLLISFGWVGFITWRAGEEFQLIHEDYQRARLGYNTSFSNHFDELREVRKQLTRILSISMLWFLFAVLGFSFNMKGDLANIGSLVGIILAGVMLVWGELRMIDTFYGRLYKRLSEVEIRTSEMESELGDPTRLLQELAQKGVNLSSMIDSSQEVAVNE